MSKKSKYEFKFEDLKVYTKALNFGEIVNDQIMKFPKKETYRLSSQFIRAADSIALNIAEDAADTDAVFNRYLKIAIGSCRECVSISTKAKLRNYISTDENEENRKSITEISKMITALRKYLNANK